MTGNGKRFALLFLAAAVVSLILLSAGISEVQTGVLRRPARLSPLEDEESAAPEPGPSLLEQPLARAATAALTMLAVAGVGYVLWKVRRMPPPRRSTSSWSVLGYLVILFAIFLIGERLRRIFGDTGRLPFETIPVPEFILNPPVLVAFSLGFILLLSLGAAVAVLWERSRPSTLDQLAQEAREAISGLRAGQDPRNVIVACYAGMCEVLRQERRLERRQAMTPREFAAALESSGLPMTAVRRLTRLFEAVRYGGHRFSPAEEQEAVDCLTDIAEAARQDRRPRRMSPWELAAERAQERQTPGS